MGAHDGWGVRSFSTAQISKCAGGNFVLPGSMRRQQVQYCTWPYHATARAEQAMTDYPGLPAQSCLPIRLILTRLPGTLNSSLITGVSAGRKRKTGSPSLTWMIKGSIEDLAAAIVPSKLSLMGEHPAYLY